VISRDGYRPGLGPVTISDSGHLDPLPDSNGNGYSTNVVSVGYQWLEQ